VSEVPPNPEPDDLDDRYRRASGRDPSRPSESVRRAVLRHATELAKQRAADQGPVKIDSRPPIGRQSWQPAMYGCLAAAALAGVLIAPRFLSTGNQTATPSPAAAPALQRNVGAQTPTAGKISGEAASAAVPAAAPAPARARAPAPAPRADINAKPQAFPSNEAADATPAAGAPPPVTRQSVPLSAGSMARAQDSAVARAPPMAAPALGGAVVGSLVGGVPGGAHPPYLAEALHRAAESGDLLTLKTLLRFRAQTDIDGRDSSGRTALMLAILSGHADAVDALLASGADPNAADSDGTTPLQAALTGNQPAIAAALRRAGAR
jgi:hypothetical protein